MKEFKHYVLTRFNLGIYSDTNPYAGKVGNADEWMKHRFRLFEQFTKMYINDQTCKDFTWLIGVDPETPADDIIRITNGYDGEIEICYEQPHSYLRRVKPSAKWLITSRLDNDDFYNYDFIVSIQNEFRAVPEVIDILYHKFRLRDGGVFISDRPRCNSPFLSLVEPWEAGICTALGHPHTDMPNYYYARKIDKVLATMVIHDRNVINSEKS